MDMISNNFYGYAYPGEYFGDIGIYLFGVKYEIISNGYRFNIKPVQITFLFTPAYAPEKIECSFGILTLEDNTKQAVLNSYKIHPFNIPIDIL